MAVAILYSKEDIQTRVSKLAQEIDKDFQGEEVVIIGVLNGSFVFVADLIREMKNPVHLDFISVSSYDGTQSTGELKMQKDIKVDIKDKNVVVVEDIVDTGLTISKLVDLFKQRGPKTLKVATLLHKSVKTEVPVQIDYLGYEIEDRFVIGYGLDFNGRYRELPYIGEYSES